MASDEAGSGGFRPPMYSAAQPLPLVHSFPAAACGVVPAGGPEGSRYGGYFQSLLLGVCGNATVGEKSPFWCNGLETGVNQPSSFLALPDANLVVQTRSRDADVAAQDGVFVADGEVADGEDADDEDEQEAPDVEASEDECARSARPVAVTGHDEGLLRYEIVQFSQGPNGCIQGPAYKKRLRFPKGIEPPDCRPPRDIGPIEMALKNGKNRIGGYIFEPVIGMVFDSRAEAYQFYNLYSWEVGFGVRFGTSARNRVNKYRTMQEIVCEKEGFDPRCTSSSKRDWCKAKLRLHRSQDHGWYVSKHIAEHNHPLSVSCGEKREWNSHSKIEQSIKNMIKYLRENNVSLSRVHCIMGSLFGSMENVPFSRKSIRAVCAEIARDHKVDDVAKTLEVFRKMRAEDPGFQFSVDLDGEKRIKTLLWTSGRSRSQYSFFGDAITFDTTYCTNLYKMPFGMFVGVNNHFQSILFAGVLMCDETADSFKWVFTEFITLMGGKAPVTILTDQSKAMTKAIKEVMQNTNHLFCKWHIFKDAPEALGPVYRRNGPFRRDFHYVINQMLTEDEFERAWADLLDRYNLRDDAFMQKCYNKKKKWAKPWCKDIFCARMASTQRSESANSILKKVVPRNCSMNRFVEQYRKLLFIRASAEETAEHRTKQFSHRGKRVYAIEKDAMAIYTKKAFQLFSAEVDKSADYNVAQGDSFDEIKVIHYNEENRKIWARCVFVVKINQAEGKLLCECGLYEHFGILCCHAIKVLIHCGVQKIPQAHIMKRWTRAAKDLDYQANSSAVVVHNQVQNSLLYVNALELVQMAEKHEEASEILLTSLSSAKKQMQAILDGKNKGCMGYSSAAPTEDDESEFEVDFSTSNNYGAVGSSHCLSDADIEAMQAPVVKKTVGRPRENRFPRMFERFKKAKKRKAQLGSDECCAPCGGDAHPAPKPTQNVGGCKKCKTVKSISAAKKITG